jgi:hypothetical protein
MHNLAAPGGVVYTSCTIRWIDVYAPGEEKYKNYRRGGTRNVVPKPPLSGRGGNDIIKDRVVA